MNRHLIIFLTSLSLLFSCGTTLEKIQYDVDKNLAAGTGYLLIGLETNRNLKSIQLSGQESLILGHKDINKEANYILVDVTAGQYTVRKIQLNNHHSVTFENSEDLSWSFDIHPNQISYVGDLEVTAKGFWLYSESYIELVNRSSEALEFMQEKFPNIRNSRKIVYTGPGEDDFFDFVETIAKESSQ